MAIVELKNVTRVYKSGDHELKALDGVNISLDEGKFVVILGPSGAGKSTLLNMAWRTGQSYKRSDHGEWEGYFCADKR